METMKRLPYGVCDFRSVRERNLYYVDKTMYLSRLEEVGDFLFFIRPRRFGKSLFLSMMRAYYTAPELELKHGFCDFFLLPDLSRYPSSHSYILELKYLPKKDFAARAEVQWQEAVEQIRQYATAPRVEQLRQGTQLHKIIMQFEGWTLKRMEEVE